MDCRGKTTTVRLCSEPECVNSTITFEASDIKTHFPHHGMFKVHRIIFDRDIGRIENTVKDTLTSAQATISQLKKEERPTPGCVRCDTTVSLPCWCCVDCTGEKFICDDCENEQLAFDEVHTKMHTLVRVSEKVEEKEVSVEERLRLVESELAKMRQLLAKLIEKVTEGSRGEPLANGDR
ncbi:hypothetical protein BDM02DRAFT_3187035 [Thelephora ganbajun]|uniref:Uncharacterized protein n=1 Tax=Thelephora ganbajun TaxID=370292 RepID=A0ACB6ZGR0_THEGA|nr:hypothetical protein BDM02DRAFT_3187035 [Thelephora ganbajun]